MNDLNSSLDHILKSISSFKINKNGNQVSLHKYIFLLSLLHLFDKDEARENKFVFDRELEGAFASQWALVFNGEIPLSSAMEYPYVHLESEGFWHIVPKDNEKDAFFFYKDTPGYRLTRKRIIDTVAFSYLDSEWLYVFKRKELRKCVKDHVLKICGYSKKDGEGFLNDDVRPYVVSENPKSPNSYVSYLNSLHSRDAGNENALAEFQACNEFFSTIHVRHPLVDRIVKILRHGEVTESIILTGHAGDGKSTIALSVYKELKGLEEDRPLEIPMKKREELALDDGTLLIVIKDFSEWAVSERRDLFKEVLSSKKTLFSRRKRLFLVSNTGTLLESVCDFAEVEGIKTRTFWESELLDKMSSEESKLRITDSDIDFSLFNLSLWDNLPLAEKILRKMLSPENWDHCRSQSCRERCPIARNVALLQEKDGLPIDRLFMMYRKIYEYGTRLTLRQLTEHFAYMLTSGLEYGEICEMQSKAIPVDFWEFAFFNRFFGDSGKEYDSKALNLKAVKTIRSHRFGERPSPAVERYLWTVTSKGKYPLGVPDLEPDFEVLLEGGIYSGKGDSELPQEDERQQVRRMLYFFHGFEDEGGGSSDVTEDGDRFLRQFLGSPCIMIWLSWQKDLSGKLKNMEKRNLKRKLYHVIQEDFTGVRLPEERGSGQSSQDLYVTLNRGQREVRQSAQIVLAEVDFMKEFDLALQERPQGGASMGRDLVLLGERRFEGVKMVLKLPFLDYMFARNLGCLSETLQAVYGDRLKRLKNDIVSRSHRREDDQVLLVRLRTNHTFFRQSYEVNGGRLEVSND